MWQLSHTFQKLSLGKHAQLSEIPCPLVGNGLAQMHVSYKTTSPQNKKNTVIPMMDLETSSLTFSNLFGSVHHRFHMAHLEAHSQLQLLDQMKQVTNSN